MTDNQYEFVCPFCAADNACMANADKPCWCVDAVVPSGLLKLVPEAFKFKTCICSNCVKTYNENPVEFQASRSKRE